MADDIKAAALEAVNQLRAERGMPTLAELPCGEMGGYRSCPIARALDAAGVAGSTIDFFRGADYLEEVHMPQAIEDFVHAFDRGKFPELVDSEVDAG